MDLGQATMLGGRSDICEPPKLSGASFSVLNETTRPRQRICPYMPVAITETTTKAFGFRKELCTRKLGA